MKAGVVHAKEDIRYEEVEKPVPKKRQVLIKVKYTGICGSDIPRVNGDACHYFPNVLGHEFSGTVESVGKDVSSVRPGDRVAGVPLVPCMKCLDCQKGNYSLCKYYSFIGSREFGSFAEYVVVPEKNAVKFNEEVSFEQGAFKVKKQMRAAKGDSIEKRPEEVKDRKEFGRWEMDTVVGPRGKSKKTMRVLTERKTRKEIIELLDAHTTECVRKSINRTERRYGASFKHILKTITVDNGSEFADYQGIETARRGKEEKKENKSLLLSSIQQL